jgi:hypothetical protein
MAGFGRRFLNAGYDLPKYRIEVHGHYLLSWSVASLVHFVERGAQCCFVVRRADESSDFIREETRRLGIAETKILEIDAPTDGQATTALLAGPLMDPVRPFLVYNIDTFVVPEALPASAPRGEGWLPCFPGSGDGWSFARVGSDGRVSEVREKRRISNHATIGLYWFHSFGMYADLYRRYYEKSDVDAGERYIAPLYNQLISDGGHVYVHDVPAEAVHPLGTPDDVDAFRRSPSPSFPIAGRRG